MASLEAPTPLSPRPQDEGEEKFTKLYREVYTELGYLPVPEGFDPGEWFDAVRKARLKWERQMIWGDDAE